MSQASLTDLAKALEAQKERLLPCVHCGFCLPACPTYNRLGDEADSPRGRLYLMKAVVEGRMSAASPAFQTHIDRCLGCRACEPVCPSGVEYGTLLELARETATRARPSRPMTRALLAIMGSTVSRRLFFLGGRLVRGTGVAALGARVLPSRGVLGTLRLALAMLAATSDWRRPRLRPEDEALALGQESPGSAPESPGTAPQSPGTDDGTARSSGRVAVLTGCVQAGLYGRVNEATTRTLVANGHDVMPLAGQGCCAALHAHGGDLVNARRLARRNIEAFERSGASIFVVNAAGCGAAMKDYGTLLEGDETYRERASAFSHRVRDVTELLAESGPRRGAPVRCSVAYDHPCHLLHAQGISQPPLDVLSAIPGVDVRVVAKADECCGGAGIYGMTHPELGGHIGRDKVTAVLDEKTDMACTPNPGCMMQIGAGLRLEGATADVVHPVELLDESYARAGFYQ